MIIGTTLTISKETNEGSLKGYSGLDVQLFFRAKYFYEINHKEVNSLLKNNGVNVVSLHYPTVREAVLPNLDILRQAYNQRLFTFHPTQETLEDACIDFSKLEKSLSQMDVELSLENLPSRKSWCNDPSNLYFIARELASFSVTYDTTHLPGEIDAIQGIEENLTSVVHLSNAKYGLKTRDHLPLEQGERDLISFLKHLKKLSYSGQIILEYRKQKPDFLKQEIAKISKIT